MKAKECNPEEFRSGLQTCSQSCVFIICLVVLEKLYVLTVYFLREAALVLVCSSCTLLLDLLSSLLCNWHLECIWMYSHPDESYVSSLSIPLVHPSPSLLTLYLFFFLLLLCFNVWTKCFGKIWKIDSEVWFMIIQEKFLRYWSSVQAFHSSRLPTKELSYYSIDIHCIR